MYFSSPNSVADDDGLEMKIKVEERNPIFSKGYSLWNSVVKGERGSQRAARVKNNYIISTLKFHKSFFH